MLRIAGEPAMRSGELRGRDAADGASLWRIPHSYQRAMTMTIHTFALILVGVLLNAAAQLMLKAGTNVTGVIGAGQATWVSQFVSVILQPFIVGGLACYVFSVTIWIAALSRVPVSVAYPMLSIGYIVNAIVAHYLFGEALSGAKLGGIAVIIVGVWIVSRS